MTDPSEGKEARVHRATELLAADVVREYLLSTGCTQTAVAFDRIVQIKFAPSAGEMAVNQAAQSNKLKGSEPRLNQMVGYTVNAAAKSSSAKNVQAVAGSAAGGAAAATAATAASGDSAASDWTAEQIAALKAALKEFPASMDRNERFRLIATKVPGQTKKSCYEQYKLLKESKSGKHGEQSEDSQATSTRTPPTTGTTHRTSGAKAAPVGKRTAKLEDEDSLAMLTGGKKVPAAGKTHEQMMWDDMLEHAKKLDGAPGKSVPAAASVAPPRGGSREIVLEASDEEDDEPVAPQQAFGSRRPTTAPAASTSRQQDAESKRDTTVGGWGRSQGPVARSGPGVDTLAMEEVDDVDADMESAAPVSSRKEPAKPAAVSKPLPSVPMPASLGFNGRPITFSEAMGLKQMMFRDGKQCFNDAWLKQGFYFTDIPTLKFGLVQTNGGPCGPIACVQAMVLKRLLFSRGSRDWRVPTAAEQASAVLEAMTEIIWRCRSPRPVVVLPGTKLCTGRTATYKPDGLTEKLMIYELSTMDELHRLLESQLPAFMHPDGSGCALLVYSAVLSRGLDNVRTDFDAALGDMAKLIGEHNYATQEMVNLLLTGRAHSNVFDGEQVFADEGSADKVVLRGVVGQGDVGFLTLFEHYQHVLVGTYYKMPRHPVWVLCSESHYSVLFSAETSVLTEEEEPFDLFYFDPLGRQEELIRLTVTPKPYPPLSTQAASADDNPPIELCIRCKWPGAAVNWNGTDPLL